MTQSVNGKISGPPSSGVASLRRQMAALQAEIDAIDTNVQEVADETVAPVIAQLNAHESDDDNPHATTKEQVGLGNADNTSDADKPISTATQAALDTKDTTVLYRSSATGLAFLAATQRVTTRFNNSTSMKGGCSYKRISFASLGSYPAGAYFRSTDRYLPNGTIDNTNGGYWVIDETEISPSMLGAVVDGVTDDTVAYAAAYTTAGLQGKTLRLDPGTMFTDGVSGTIKAIRGYGQDASIIKLNPAGTLTGIVATTNATYSDFSVECDDAAFDNAYPFASSGADNVTFERIKVIGRFQRGIFVNGGTLVWVIDCTVTSTDSTVDQAIQFTGVTGGGIDGCYFSGEYADHVINVDQSVGVKVGENDITGASPVGFAVSIFDSERINVYKNWSKNSGREAYQFTLVNDSLLEGNIAEWDSGHGEDFGISLDACLRCSVSGNIMYNAYKAAIALAADNGLCYGNLITHNKAYNCATRATAAALGPPSDAVYLSYVGPSNIQLNTWQGNEAHNTAATGYGYLESDPGAAGTITETHAKGFRFSGTAPTVPFSIAVGSFLWMDRGVSYVPTITAASGTITAYTVNRAEYKLDGEWVDWAMRVTITTNGTGAGALLATLPFTVKSGQEWPALGRTTNGGVNVTGVASSTTLTIRDYANQYPAVSGSVIDMSGRFRLNN